MVGPAVLLAWLLVYRQEIFRRLHYVGTVVCGVLWMLGMFIMWNYPTFQFWDINKSFNTTGPDALGLYSGSFYLPALLMILGIILIACIIVFFTRKRLHTPHDQIQIVYPDRIRPKKWMIAGGIICVVLGVMLPIGIASYYVPQNTPQILSRMGNEGILWLANEYDRISQSYSFQSSNVPVNSDISLYVMEGENQTAQVVFTNYAEQLQTFTTYQFGSDPTSRNDNLWINTITDNTTAINLTMGFVDYVNLYGGQIEDILSPWGARTTTQYANYPIWIDIGVPTGITPGTYLTYIGINFQSWISKTYVDSQLTFFITLHVWNITLPLEHSVETAIVTGNYGQSLYNLEYAYRADPYMVAFPTVTVDFNNLSAGMTIDWSTFDQQVAAAFNEGANVMALNYFPNLDCYNNPTPILNGSDNNYLTAVRWFYGNASAHLSNLTTPWGTTWESQFYCSDSDEPQTLAECTGGI